MKYLQRFVGFFWLVSLCLCSLSKAQAQMQELVFSEYGEGSGNNKYLEIYNGTGKTIDLAAYQVWKISNGGSWKEDSLSLSGTLADKQTLILHHPQANPTISNAGNLQIASERINFNGNDALALVKNGQILDLIGEEGADPSTAWEVGGTPNATQDHVLVRKANVCSPAANWASSRGSSASDSQWKVLANQDWSDVGKHTADCQALTQSIIAQDDLDGSTLKLLDKNIPALDGGPGDYFGMGNLRNWPQSASGVPFSLSDDSQENVGGAGVSADDKEGIFGKNRNKDDIFFGISDSDEFGDRQTARWTFDIQGFKNLELQVDMGGMADGSGFPNQAELTFEVSINEGVAQKAFVITPFTTDSSLSYRPMDNGSIIPMRRVLRVSGDNPVQKLRAEDKSLSDNTYLDKTPTEGAGAGLMDTYTTLINGTGTSLTLTLKTNFPFEAMAFDNIRILGIPGETDNRPFVNIALAGPNAAEVLSDPGVFRISRTGSTQTPLNVAYKISGTTAPNDYTPRLSGSITIPAGQISTDIRISPLNDTLKEGKETLTLTLMESTSYNLGTREATLTIGDDDTSADLIHSVQGEGAISPRLGEKVTLEAIVTGDFQNNDPDVPGKFDPDHGDLNGFYIQEENAEWDDNERSSEGIFVFEGAGAPKVDVKPGDRVRVSGEVAEYSSATSKFTQLIKITEIQVLGQGTLPEPIDIRFPLPTQDFLERYEGMQVRLPQSLVISEYFSFDRTGEIVLSNPLEGLPTDRHFSPTTYLNANTAIDQANQEISLNRITLDDGRPSTTSGNSPQNPDPARHPNGQIFNLENRFRGGDRVSNMLGILEETFGKFRIHPTQGVEYTSANPRQAQPDEVGGRLKVASFNVLNYFTSLGIGDAFRGANDQAEFERQRTKIFAALKAINADVLGLIEIENNNDTALKDLLKGLNETLDNPDDRYELIATGKLGNDAITVAMIYRPKKVKLVGKFAALLDKSFTDPKSTGQQKNRPALAQTFEEISSREKFTLVVNHLKSKGSGCGEGDDDPRQGNCNETRRASAAALVRWLKNDPTGSNDPDFLIVGDLNSYDQEDPIQEIIRGADGIFSSQDDYVDLLKNRIGEFAYGYNFDGKLGYLDYGMASSTLAPQVTGVTEWHINSDEPDILDYDKSFKQDAQDALYEPNPFRSSDHDPVVLGLNLFHAEIVLIQSTDPRNCENRNGTLTVVATPEEGLQYSINGGIDFQDSPQFKGLNSGNCRVVIRRKDQPEVQDRFRSVIRLTSPEAPFIRTLVPQNPSAPGQNDGRITVLLAQESSDYEFSLDGQNYQSSSVFENLSTGKYQIYVRRKNRPACESDTSVTLSETR
ncbi:MAG: ExeM/NucH family extracellular endonuclease [Microscillaceae bacterium]|nr:ExeM/NucH family extracellular endonuclease [Microscillaceae bacterium]